jgi:2-polyprenyl-3-methyl-5-hydroxy-6-metoxy-1,4-benzoquinol methylase
VAGIRTEQEEKMSVTQNDNLHALRAWNTNAHFWDERMGDGNDFFTVLVWPAVATLLRPTPGEHILDIACGNGVTSRRLAQGGATVTAFDFSDEMISLARKRNNDLKVEYRVIDATDASALRELGVGRFDGALCNMALMDLADIAPLMKALATLLRPAGRFVFSVLHPCFNNPSTVQMGETEDRAGNLVSTYSVKVSRYLTPYSRVGLAMHGQPTPHPYFHRPLGALLGCGFEAGFVLDALEERAFPPDNTGGTTPLSWNGRFSEIPPVIVGRMIPRTVVKESPGRFSRRSPAISRDRSRST